MNWIGRHQMRAAIIGALAIGLFGCATATPRLDRDWLPYLARTPDVTLSAEHFSVTPVSDWTYTAEGPETQTYIDASYDIADLREVWFMLEPQPGSRLAAHTLLLFEFEGDRMLGLTIEARRERSEDYSVFRGLWNTYELAYIWASARDLLIRRAVMLDHEVFLYPVAIADEQKRGLLTAVLQRTAELETEPRFYNTIFSNCTNELAKAAGFDWAPAFVLTGRSDEYLFKRGIIPGETFDEAHAQSDITDFVRRLNSEGVEDFDAALLAEMRRRSTP